MAIRKPARRLRAVDCASGAECRSLFRHDASPGTEPVWRKDGTEIFYLSADGQMMAVPVKSQASIQVGKPKALFDVRGVSDFPPSYDVTRNGKGFLVNRNIGEGKPGYVLVIANWEALLKHSAVAR